MTVIVSQNGYLLNRSVKLYYKTLRYKTIPLIRTSFLLYYFMFNKHTVSFCMSDLKFVYIIRSIKETAEDCSEKKTVKNCRSGIAV